MKKKRDKKLTIRLTIAEAKALLRATDNTLGWPDAEEGAFATKRQRDAAYRAHEAIVAALYPAPEGHAVPDKRSEP